jgi:hypothetical protein
VLILFVHLVVKTFFNKGHSLNFLFLFAISVVLL